jgi:serine/threonine protein kinase
MNEQIPSEQSIFLAALDWPAPAERAAYLDRVCAGNQRLRAEVEALLAAHLRLGGLTATPDPGPRPGTAIGPYKLLQQIGEGGMGVVFMAEQTHPVRRKVAVKVIKAGMDTRQVIARFEAERQALALMDHPHIAHVLDAGATEDGRPYFVMELVKGVPLTTYCDDHRLTPRQRLELFVPVCQAVQHAHQKGIIHRDLKPSNVLVALYDGRPVPKVIDFGVAKAAGSRLTERTLFTEFGAVVGTLEYMSPEQAELNQLDVDTRSDIYSLGVVLYELLSGSTPLEHQRLKDTSFLEALRLIREEEPPPPSTRLSTATELPRIAANRGLEPKNLSNLLRGELDWITLKALEKDRTRRYDSANDLARDIARYLNDEPVLACPASAGYRLRKLVRRHRGAVLAAAVVLLALAGGMLGTTAGLVEAQRQRYAADRARLDEVGARQAAEGQRDRAVKAEQEARANETKARTEEGKARASEHRAKQEETRARASEQKAQSKEEEARTAAIQARAAEVQARTVLDFFQEHVLAAARPEDLNGGLGVDATIRDAVDAAEPLIAMAFKQQPLAEASVRNVLGLTYLYLGKGKLAVQQHQRALELYQDHASPNSAETLQTMSNLAAAYRAVGQLREAIPLFEKALYRARLALGPTDVITAGLINNLAGAYQAAGRTKDAVALYEEAVQAFQIACGPVHPQTLRALNNLAVVYQSDGRLPEAIKLHEIALQLREAQLGRTHPDTLISLSNLAYAYKAAGRVAEAVLLCEEVLAQRRLKFGAEHPLTLLSMNNLAATYRAAGRLAEALPLYEKALELRQAQLGPDHPDTLLSMNNLASTYQTVGRFAEALPLYQEALKRKLAQRGSKDPSTLLSKNNLGVAYMDTGRLAEAEVLLRAAVDDGRAVLGPAHPDVRLWVSNLANCFELMGRDDEAERLWAEAATFWKREKGPTSLPYASCLAGVGLYQLRQHTYVEAERTLREALAIYAQRAPDAWTTFHLRSLLGGSLTTQGRYAEAEPLLVAGYEGMKQRQGLMPTRIKFRLREALDRLLRLYEVTGHQDRASRGRQRPDVAR